MQMTIYITYITYLFLTTLLVIRNTLTRKADYIIPDCIDLQIEVAPVEFDQMSSTVPAESSESIRQRVIAARQIQTERYKDIKDVHCNAQMTSKLLHQYAEPDAEGLELLRDAMTRLNMSARAYDRILKVARTIADLDGCAQVMGRHVQEAISYRNLDRANWAETGW